VDALEQNTGLKLTGKEKYAIHIMFLFLQVRFKSSIDSNVFPTIYRADLSEIAWMIFLSSSVCGWDVDMPKFRTEKLPLLDAYKPAELTVDLAYKYDHSAGRFLADVVAPTVRGILTRSEGLHSPG
jgi:hypothetical protein